MYELREGSWYFYDTGYEFTDYREENTELHQRSWTFLGSNVYHLNPLIVTPHIFPIDSDSSAKTYKLMEYPGLFMEFASIRNEENMINFANNYGLLHGSDESGDSIFLWNDQVSKMNIVINIINSIRKNESHKIIKQHINNQITCITNIEFLSSTPFKGTETSIVKNIYEKDGRFFLEQIDLFDVKENKFTYIHKQIPLRGKTRPANINEAIHHYISALVDQNIKDCLSLQASVNNRNTGLELTTNPIDLLAALWLQLAYFISKSLDFKQCADCPRFFEVKSKKRKNEKIYCSDRCRVRAAARRNRKKEKAK